MRRSSSLLFLAALCSSIACDDEPASPSASTPAAASPSKAVKSSETKPSATPETKSTPGRGGGDEIKPATSGREVKAETVTRAQRTAAVGHIARGRTLSKDKKLDEALAAFEAAMKANPGSSTAACEAGYAALRLGKLDRAQRDLELGLQLVQQPNKEAACRYNLGLVAEKRGDPERAIEHYKVSLTLRDNATVRAKLAKLAPTGTCVPPARMLDPTKVACGLPDDYWDCGVTEDGERVTHEFERDNRFPDAEEIGPGVRLVTASAWFGERQRIDLLLERDGGHQLLAELGWFVVSVNSTRVDRVVYTHRDLVPGGAEEVIIEVQEAYEDDVGDAALMDCESKFDDQSPQFEACADKALDQPFDEGVRTYYFGCGEVEGHWACGRTETEPTTEAAFMALFHCGASK